MLRIIVFLLELVNLFLKCILHRLSEKVQLL